MRNGNILVVEDNPDDLELTLRVLKKVDISGRIEVARDGAEALIDGAGADAHGGGHVPGAFAPVQAGNQNLSTSGRQAGIVMDVHSVLLKTCNVFSTGTL